MAGFGRIKKLLEQSADFLEPYSNVSNTVMQDFITSDLWEKNLCTDWKAFLLKLDNKECLELATGTFQSDVIRNAPASLQSFLHTQKELCGLFEGIIKCKDDLVKRKGGCVLPMLPFDQYSSIKKTHEVIHMSSFLAQLANHDADKTVDIVDIGSGKGYLSSLLCHYYGLLVVGIDGVSSNTEGASLRNEKLQKQWDILVRRARERQETGSVMKRGKNWKARKKKEDEESETCKGLSGEAQKTTDFQNDGKEPPEKEKVGQYVPITAYVTGETNLDNLLKENVSSENEYGMSGLHTCGYLGVDMLQAFLSSANALWVCSVPCCFHLLTEEFRSDRTDNYTGLVHKSTPGFPLSSILRSRGFWLGRGARMLSLQAPDKYIRSEKIPYEHHFWRALLQVILNERVGSAEYIVGKLANKCGSFLEYYKKAIKRLKLQIQLSDEEILGYLEKYSEYEQKIGAYFSLRVSLARIIENVILLDRLCFLLEQDCVTEAHLVRLFDPTVSPRCIAVVAFR